VEKSRGDESKRREKGIEEVEMIRNMGKKEREEQAKSDRREKVFCLWRFWVYYLLL